MNINVSSAAIVGYLAVVGYLVGLRVEPSKELIAGEMH